MKPVAAFPGNGLNSSHPDALAIKRAMLKRSEEHVVLLDAGISIACARWTI